MNKQVNIKLTPEQRELVDQYNRIVRKMNEKDIFVLQYLYGELYAFNKADIDTVDFADIVCDKAEYISIDNENLVEMEHPAALTLHHEDYEFMIVPKEK